jgi:hypothetical protein
MAGVECARCRQAQNVAQDLQACLNQIVSGYDREIKRSVPRRAPLLHGVCTGRHAVCVRAAKEATGRERERARGRGGEGERAREWWGEGERARGACAESEGGRASQVLLSDPLTGPCRLSKELERARSRAGGDTSGAPATCSGGPELISYGNIPGFAEEMRHLGDCYMQGSEGHLKDAGRAFKYYEAAAVHGCVCRLRGCACASAQWPLAHAQAGAGAPT